MLKRNRSHQYGQANIDFRSKREESSLSLYQPWKNPGDFGSMGKAYYQMPYSKKKELMKIAGNLIKVENYKLGFPDPKTYNSCLFYQKNHIPLKVRENLSNEREGHLDESIKGKDIFIGQSMMIPLIRRQRKKNSLKRILLNDIKYIDQNEVSRLEKEIEEDDKKYNQVQTQWMDDKYKLNKLIAKNNLSKSAEIINYKQKKLDENKINIKKLEQIRRELKKKYENRKNFRQIFKDWDLSCKGEISANDAHKMINFLGMPITLNETKALIAFSNIRGTDTLNLNEFMKLILNENSSENDNIIKDLIDDKGELIINKDVSNSIDNFKNKLKGNMQNIYNKDQMRYIEEFFRLKIPKLIWEINRHNCPQDMVDHKTFEKILDNFHIPQHYYDDGIIENLFNKYCVVKKDENNKETKYMNFKLFAETVINNTLNSEQNNYFSLKNLSLANLDQKIQKSQSELNLNHSSLVNYRMFQNKLKQEYDKQIQEKNERDKILNFRYGIDDSSMQPSTSFIHKIFDGRQQAFEKLNKIEKEFEVDKSVFIPKTRTSANPKFKNTFEIIQPDEKSGQYISEFDRFNVKGLNNKIDFIWKDKERRLNCLKCKGERINLNNLENKNRVDGNISFNLQRECFSQYNRAKRQYKFEMRKKLENELIE